MARKPWEGLAVGSKAWVDAHEVKIPGGKCLQITKEDAEALRSDPRWREEHLKAIRAILELTRRSNIRQRMIR